ncbi:MAG: hypothetical protein QMD36_01610 [Candidatus Aenigmarchaeota archaeon]|nr:hypothetical protein [Candidatus Aenigmarchaeota archaeon]
MKFNSFLAFLFTIIAILIIIFGFAISLSDLFPIRMNCEGYSLFLFPDEKKLDTEVGKGQLLKIRAINAGSFGDRYEVSLKGPEWTAIKPTTFSLKSEESKTLFLYVSPDLGNEGKYYLDVEVKSKCVSESETIEIGVLPKV